MGQWSNKVQEILETFSHLQGDPYQGEPYAHLQDVHADMDESDLAELRDRLDDVIVDMKDGPIRTEVQLLFGEVNRTVIEAERANPS
jgi:hypothetical protein